MASLLAGFVFTALVACSWANNTTDANVDKHFLIATSDGHIRVYSWDFSTNETLRMPEPPDNRYSLTLDYHYSKRLIFIRFNMYLFKTTYDPQHSTVGKVSNAQKVTSGKVDPGFAVDWVHGRIYYADYKSGDVKYCGLNGQAQLTVLSKPGGWLIRMEVDPYKGILFWISKRVIQSVRTSGKGFMTNVSKAEVHWYALALDLRRQRVYYVGYMDETLYSMDYTGGKKMKHFNVLRLENVRGLSILGHKVIWHHNIGWEDATIYEAQLNLTGTENVKLLKRLNSGVTHMRVMHPSLQIRPEIEPCLAKGCTHSCVASGTTMAVCECPPGQALNLDGVSCHTGAMSILTMLLIVTVMMTSLVCLGYKYWRLLQSRLLGIP